MYKNNDILQPRRQRLTIRDIVYMAGVSKSTVYKIIKANPTLEIGTYDCNTVQYASGIYKMDETNLFLFHLPYNYFCLDCGLAK